MGVTYYLEMGWITTHNKAKLLIKKRKEKKSNNLEVNEEKLKEVKKSFWFHIAAWLV